MLEERVYIARNFEQFVKISDKVFYRELQNERGRQGGRLSSLWWKMPKAQREAAKKAILHRLWRMRNREGQGDYIADMMEEIIRDASMGFVVDPDNDKQNVPILVGEGAG